MTRVFSEQEWTEKLERQRQMEDFASSLGKDRFERRLKKAQEGGRGSTAGGTKKALLEAIEPTARAIQREVQEVKDRQAKQGGPAPVAIRWVNKLGVDVCAFLTARVVLDGIHEPKTELKDVSRHITKLMLHELRYRRFQEEAPGLFHYRMNSFDTQSYAHRSRSLNAAMSYAEVDISDIDMSQRERLLVGAWLIHLFISATGLVETYTEVVKDKSTATNKSRRQYLVPSEGTLEWLSKRNEALAALQPVKMPMLVPPLPWRKGDRGGYRFSLRGQYPMIRSWGRTDGTKPEDYEIPVVRGALDRLQDTGWKINRHTHSLVTEIVKRGGDMCGIPAMDTLPEHDLHYTLARLKTEHPEDEAIQAAKVVDNGGLLTVDNVPEDAAKVIIGNHRHSLGLIKDANYYRYIEQLGHEKIMFVANELADEDVFFFPYNCDFRGRIYPISDYLSPQGSDLEKGLLTFADKRPMGTTGGKWLAIHLMNSMGVTPGGRKVSKMTLLERQIWVEDNTDLILQVARDPFGDRWWMETVDEPFQFYAACSEWADWGDAGYGSEYLSGLPVAVDGSCNGLQHFAAAFRDDYGAIAVNVTPNPAPNDVYAIVADTVKERVERDVVGGVPWASEWNKSALINRSLTKTPTMTFGYGSKPYGMSQQVVDYLTGSKKVDAEEVFDLFAQVDTETGEVSNGIYGASSYMSFAIWDALGTVVEKAKGGMSWFQQCARIITNENKPVEWTVPVTGFPVTQGYFRADVKRIDTVLAGSVRLRSSYYKPTDEVEPYKQANGIAPNVIHSLDAAALMMTVVAASTEGIEAFGMVHDSYATVPGDMDLLVDVLREEFVSLYDRPVIEDLKDQWQEQAEEEVMPDAPSPGELGLYGVLISDYFFA